MSRAEHMTTTRGRRVRPGLVPAALGLGLAVLLAGCGAGQITQTDTQVPAVNGASGNVGPIAVRNVQLAYPHDSQGVYPPGSSAPLVLSIVNTGLAADELLRVTTPAAVSVTIDGSPTGTKALPGNFAVMSGSDVDGLITTAPPTSDTTTSGATTSASPTTTGTTTSGTTTAGGTATEPPASGDTATSGASATPTGTSVSPSPTASAVATPPGIVRIELVGIKSVNGAPLRVGLTIPITFYFAHAGQLTITGVPIGAPADNNISAAASAGNG